MNRDLRLEQLAARYGLDVDTIMDELVRWAVAEPDAFGRRLDANRYHPSPVILGAKPLPATPTRRICACGESVESCGR